jgi:biotin transporter BioY
MVVVPIFIVFAVAAFATGWMPREHRRTWRGVWLVCFVALVLGAAAGAW